MRAIYYYEYYPHYMGEMSASVRFTPKQFDTLISLAKAAIKENESLDGAEGDADEELREYIQEIEDTSGEKVYALDDALLNYYDSPRRPGAITSALKRKSVWSGQWEEGSFAFASTIKKARKAVAVIEAKVAEMEHGW